MPATDLYSHLNWRQREDLSMNGKFDRAISDWVRKGAIQRVNGVIDNLRNSGQYAQEFEEYYRPDFDKMLDNDGTVIVIGSDKPFYFKTTDLSTAELKDDGSCMIDLKRFAKDHGIDLNNWSFDIRRGIPVTGAEREDSGNCPEEDVLVGLVTAESYGPGIELDSDFWSAQHAIDNVLVPILIQTGNVDLAQRLKDDAWAVIGEDAENGRYKYVDYGFISDEQSFDSVVDAQRDACSKFEIEDDYSEIAENWLVTDDFAHWLKKEGCVVVEFDEMTIWGRHSSGMAFSGEGIARNMFAQACSYDCDKLIREILPEAAAEIDAKLAAQVAELQGSKENSADGRTLG